jgi:hypothetical protein
MRSFLPLALPRPFFKKKLKKKHLSRALLSQRVYTLRLALFLPVLLLGDLALQLQFLERQVSL